MQKDLVTRTATFYILIITLIIADLYYVTSIPIIIINIIILTIVSYLYMRLLVEARKIYIGSTAD